MSDIEDTINTWKELWREGKKKGVDDSLLILMANTIAYLRSYQEILTMKGDV